MRQTSKFKKKIPAKTIGYILLTIGLITVLFDIVFNIITGIWIPVIMFILLVGIFLVLGKKETLIGLASLSIGIALWLYLEYLQVKLGGSDINRDTSPLGRASAFIISTCAYVFFRWYFIQPIQEFFRSLWEMVSLPKVSKALVHLAISYTSITIIFGIVYATIYAFAGAATFHANEPLHLSDFIYYSFFIPTTMGYPDISPSHWLAKLLTVVEFLFGIAVIVIYLGAIVGNISEHISKKKTG